MNLDDDRHVSSRFLPYQLAWIADDADVRIAEKSVRIGWTFADAFKNVRKRLRFKNRDYLFASKDWPTALDYLETCKTFLDAYNQTRTIILATEDFETVPTFDADGKATGFTQEIKVGRIKLDTGSDIIAFSANPDAMRAFGGDVGLDEFAFHANAERLWASAAGRTAWGNDAAMWSSHNGDDTVFAQFVRDCTNGLNDWSHYRVTVEDAIEQGLVEKINKVSGKDYTREQWLEAQKQKIKLPDRIRQELYCEPLGSAQAFVSTLELDRCQRPLDHFHRIHLESDQVTSRFGTYDKTTADQRADKIRRWLASEFAHQLEEPHKHALGFDIAASGTGDLAAVWVDRVFPTEQVLSALVTCRTDDWHFIHTVADWFMDTFPAITGAGDATGLGKRTCWQLAADHPDAFHEVPFSVKSKADLGSTLQAQVKASEKILPDAEEHRDIRADIFALRTSGSSPIRYTATPNPLNPSSHCDMAWAGALASYAAKQSPTPVLSFLIQ